MPILGTIASSRLGAPANGYVSLATYTATGGESAITFTGINQSYTHLEIRWIARCNSSGSAFNDIFLQFNGVTSANYSRMYQGGNNGTLAANGGATGQTAMLAGVATQNGLTSGIFACGVTRIPNYTSTTGYKTQRTETGWSTAGQTGAMYQETGGLWSSTNAITSLSWSPQSDTWTAGSRFSLYGIK
jgi:hypothetical protein